MKEFLWATHYQARPTKYSNKELNALKKVHVVFDEDNNLKKLKVNDEDELNELFQAHKSEGSRAEAVKNMETDNVDRDSSEKIEENDKYEEGPGPMQNTNKVETHSQENDDLRMKKVIQINFNL